MLISMGISAAVCGALAICFILPMILQRYRSDIIGYDIRTAQSFYDTYSRLATACIIVALSSFIAIAAVKSYFVEPHLIFSVVRIASELPTGTILTIITFAFPLVGSAQTTLTGELKDEINTTSKVESAVSNAYGYVRQSQTDEDESASIQSQKKTAKAKAKEDDVNGLTIFEDKNESGFSFERSGFQNLIEQLERDPRPIYLDRIDRLGRDTLETVFVAATIHYDYDISIITAKHGDYDLDKINDQLDLVLNAIIAGKSVKNRVRAAWESITLRLVEERKWHSWFDNVPVGYQKDGQDWIEPTEHASEVIEAICHDLLKTETRSTTVKNLRSAGRNDILSQQTFNVSQKPTLSDIEADKIQSVFQKSDYDLAEFDASQLKRLLTNHVLIGEVRYPRSNDYEEQEEFDVPDLQVIDEEVFEEVNDFLDEQANQNSTDKDASVTMSSLADHGMVMLAVDTIDVIKPVCPECNRGMVRNGEDKEYPLDDGRLAHYWICPKYNEEDSEPDCQRKVPKKKEWDAIQNDLEDSHTNRSDVVLLKVCPPQN